MAHDVFVSYSSTDRAVADAAVAALESDGVRCWYAPRDIDPGVDWGDAIARAVSGSRVFLLVFSGNANRSQRVLDELNLAISREVAILPFRIENLDPSGAMLLHLSARHWLDAYSPSWKPHIGRLVASALSILGTAEGSADRAPLSPTETGPAGRRSAPRWLKRWRLAALAGAVVVVTGAVVGFVRLAGSGAGDMATTLGVSTSVADTAAPATTATTATTVALTATDSSTTTEAGVAGEMGWTQLPSDVVFQEAGKQVLIDGSGSQAMNAIGYHSSCYFAVGQDDSGGDLDAAVWTSCTGFDWTRVPHDEAVFGGAGDQGMRAVVQLTSGSRDLVAVGYDFDDSAVWLLGGADDWSRVPHDETPFGNSRMESVTAYGAGLIAVGSDYSGGDEDAAVWTSLDGLAWTRAVIDETVVGGAGDQEMRSVETSPSGALVAVGSDDSGGDEDAAVWTSDDGIVWTRYASGALGGSGNQVMNDVHWDGCFQMVGADDSGGDWDAAQWVLCKNADVFRNPHDEAVLGGDGDQVWLATWSPGDAPGIAIGYDDATGAVWTSSAFVIWSRVPENTALFGDHESVAPVAPTALTRLRGSPTVIVVGRDGPNAAVWAFRWDPAL